MGGGEDAVLASPEKNVNFLSGPIKHGVRTMFRAPISHAGKLQIAKNRRLTSRGGVRFGRGSRARAPHSFNEQVTVNSEQVSAGRGVPPSRQHERNKNMNDTTKSKTPRATDERFVARGRRAYWENGRLVRSMDGPCAAPATDETSVVPVSAAILAARLGGTPRPTVGGSPALPVSLATLPTFPCRYARRMPSS